MFVEPAYAASHEYTQFWEDLNAGKFQTAEYKRLGKGGKEIWIQASYNPILDFERQAVQGREVRHRRHRAEAAERRLSKASSRPSASRRR